MNKGLEIIINDEYQITYSQHNYVLRTPTYDKKTGERKGWGGDQYFGQNLLAVVTRIAREKPGSLDSGSIQELSDKMDKWVSDLNVKVKDAQGGKL